MYKTCFIYRFVKSILIYKCDLKEEKYNSFYLDNYSRVGNMISIEYRANDCMIDTIKKIVQIYGLSV